MKYAIIENDKVDNIVVAEPEFAKEQGWIAIEYESSVCEGWGYVDGQFVPPPRDLEAEWQSIRDERDRLLEESDAYVLPDRWNLMTPEKQLEWASYRQALRDIPEIYAAEPRALVWPIKPTT